MMNNLYKQVTLSIVTVTILFIVVFIFNLLVTYKLQYKCNNACLPVNSYQYLQIKLGYIFLCQKDVLVYITTFLKLTPYSNKMARDNNYTAILKLNVSSETENSACICMYWCWQLGGITFTVIGIESLSPSYFTQVCNQRCPLAKMKYILEHNYNDDDEVIHHNSGLLNTILNEKR